MYKIYINDNVLILASTEDVARLSKKVNAIFAPYAGKKKMLLSYIDMLEKTNRFQNVVLHAPNFKKLKKDFKSLYVRVPAGGGVVINNENELLLIKRLGKIDLPKGKLDNGENTRKAALRETSEETGVHKLELVRKLGKTRHAFRQKNGRRAMKISHWYLMRTKKQKVKPQESENITKAFWADSQRVIELLPDSYRNVRDFIEEEVLSILRIN